MTKEELKGLRSKSKLTQAKLAALLGVQLSTVSRWEAGNRSISEAMANLINFTLNHKKGGIKK